MIDKEKLNNKMILICDDDEDILEVIKIMLESRGYQVKTLTSGRAIQKRVKEYRPDLILLDIWMPGIEGGEVTKILKREKTTKDIPIIIISALNETKEIAKQVGANGFLSKPFEMEDLFRVVRQYT